jgi:hypothetical protein
LILFVFAYHNDGEFNRFQFILDHWEQLLDMKIPFQFLFVKSIDRDLRTRFRHQFLERRDPPDLKKFQCIGQEWAMVAQYIESSVDCTHWFWWEQDVVPVQRDCFDFFIRKWTPSCRIMGYRVRDNKWGMKNRINGVALYARDYWSFIKPYFNLLGTSDTRKEFGRKDKGLYVEINDWYALLHHEGRLVLTPSLRLVHGVRDDQLMEQVLTGNGPVPVVTEQYRKLRNAWVVVKHKYRRSGYRRYRPEA